MLENPYATFYRLFLEEVPQQLLPITNSDIQCWLIVFLVFNLFERQIRTLLFSVCDTVVQDTVGYFDAPS